MTNNLILAEVSAALANEDILPEQATEFAAYLAAGAPGIDPDSRVDVTEAETPKA